MFFCFYTVPTLMKATADDENPCPGYLFQEIGKISHESSASGQCLLEYLLERLQVESCHVKLKVLKIFVHLCGHGSNLFLTELRRNSTFIQQASVYSGPPDPIHGTALYQKVRNTAQVRHRGRYLLCQSNIPDRLNTLTYFVFLFTGSGQVAFHRYTKKQCIPTQPSHPDNGIPFVFTPGLTQRCPGQVGGGWEETDSGTSSSHNSSQDMAANSRASVGSNGDFKLHIFFFRLVCRVEALQLGDCGQEMALINRLTEGSRVFLSREETQHFIKECSILNCEVVVELLSSKLQDPSNTVKMRAMCAISCLMTSDLLSLEQMFGATQRRLFQLSEGAPGPVANKATKILRQFEALMGGGLHAPRQENSNHRTTTNQLSTSTHSDPLLPTHSADNPNLMHCVTKPPNHPASPSGLALDQRESSVEMNDCDLDSAVQMELVHDQVEPVRTAEDESEPDTERSSSPPAEPHSETPRLSGLSLFSGMELVTKLRPLCERETSQTERNIFRENLSVLNGNSDDAPTVCNSLADSSQPVSAFSFLNF
uniref:TEPSIN adaptor related protein complex 4 accessory protein n=1 Tax=Labrus bergylta TaxID=56723 RepID=A0A3Q3EWN5_9LABR